MCTFCGECSAICQYGAIASLPQKTLTYPELCHGCGGCQLVCSVGAITEHQREIGVVENGIAGGVRYIGGRLRIGEAQSPPLIRAVKSRLPAAEVMIIDAPPGTSCPVIAAVKGADYVILVTEPTPFGLHDLQLAVEMLKVVGLPCGVVINRADIGYDGVQQYCARENLSILMRIPDHRHIAEAYSRGIPAVTALPELAEGFVSLFEAILELHERRNARVRS